MSEPAGETVAPGRPSAGPTLARSVREEAARRGRSRNVGALGRLAPFARAHWGDASFALLFLVMSTGATLGITGAVRVLVDHLTRAEALHAGAHAVDRWFVLLGGVALALAAATALRYFFVTRLGERVVA